MKELLQKLQDSNRFLGDTAHKKAMMQTHITTSLLLFTGRPFMSNAVQQAVLETIAKFLTCQIHELVQYLKYFLTIYRNMFFAVAPTGRMQLLMAMQ